MEVGTPISVGVVGAVYWTDNDVYVPSLLSFTTVEYPEVFFIVVSDVRAPNKSDLSPLESVYMDWKESSMPYSQVANIILHLVGIAHEMMTKVLEFFLDVKDKVRYVRNW